MDISSYLKAGYPALYIVTLEPDRAIGSIRPEGWRTFSWDCQRGIVDLQSGMRNDDSSDPLSSLKWLSGKEDTVLFVYNFHHFLGSVEIIQEIQNSLPSWKGQGCCLVLVGPQVSLPSELEKYFTMLDFELPGALELRRIQEELGESVGIEADVEAVEAALGLTEFEAETAFARSLVERKRFCREIVTEQKKQMIKRTGLMEFWPPVSIEEVGGLDLLKEYINNRKKAFEPGNDHLPRPKALLLVGVPGCGKSLSCKAAASILGWPLIRLDLSALKGSLVGESERKMRQATATIDAFGKAVIWCDELEKVRRIGAR